MWSDDNPHWHTSNKNQGADKVVVWMGMLGVNLVGPFFYRTTVNSEQYLHMLDSMVLPKLNEIGFPLFFQQDGAPPHFANIVRNWLNQIFPNHWIGRGGPIPWAPRSPDLTPCDFFLWGYLKHVVYSTPIESVDHLMDRIVEEAEKITPEMLLATADNFKKRVNLCLYQNGYLFEHLL